MRKGAFKKFIQQTEKESLRSMLMEASSSWLFTSSLINNN